MITMTEHATYMMLITGISVSAAWAIRFTPPIMTSPRTTAAMIPIKREIMLLLSEAAGKNAVTAVLIAVTIELIWLRHPIPNEATVPATAKMTASHFQFLPRPSVM